MGPLVTGWTLTVGRLLAHRPPLRRLAGGIGLAGRPPTTARRVVPLSTPEGFREATGREPATRNMQPTADPGRED